MRLNSSQINGILNGLNSFMEGVKGELRLYGSRVDDTLKGGDIDLLLIIEDSSILKKIRAEKHYLLSAIKKEIDDQKIDLTIVHREEIKKDNFLNLIFPTSVLLHIWG